MIRPGFILIQLIIFFVVASMMTFALFESLNQTNRVVRLSDNMIHMDQRILLVQDRLEKDITGAFIPLYVPQKGEKNKKGRAQEEKVKEKRDEKDDSKKGARFKPITKAFYSINEDKNLKELAFITNNPLLVYGTSKPRIARVRYMLESDEAHKEAFKLVRQESLKLSYESISREGGPRGYVIADNIQSFSLAYYTSPKKKKEAEETEAEFVETDAWNSDTRFKDQESLLAHHLIATISLWDASQDQSLEYEFIFPIFADPNPQVTTEKEEKAVGGQRQVFDIKQMPHMQRFTQSYREHRWQQKRKKR